MVMSGRWPEPIQGSLVMMQSPGFQFSIGMRLMKFLSASGSMPTKEGMPAVFSASESPFESMRTVAKSFDSRTMVENEVRSRAAADSSAMEINRLHRISNVTGSKFAFAEFVMGPLFSCRVSGGRGVPLSLQTRIEFAKVELQMLFLYVVTFIFIAERETVLSAICPACSLLYPL